jgi:hypothetical protein
VDQEGDSKMSDLVPTTPEQPLVSPYARIKRIDPDGNE